ncbi:hypothetical protein M378DRAFT_167398 [Amanita muscaria Koide BX008]|uniref:Uncharacterized protein n=1 Tax=Amanita muscaria (strain Koide BX008) TaxID=946122 RepID=A0A0C2WW68_AMAMK|nr:hypothetical protein M378DRAFT_167398 [Amanita muscaria Koide BX008]
MSRGSGRGGRGSGRRGGFGGSSNPLPMGLTFSDIQNMSREATALYPVCDRPSAPASSYPRRLPVFTQPSEEEKQVAQLQLGFANRLKSSPYYIVEKTKSTGK